MHPNLLPGKNEKLPADAKRICRTGQNHGLRDTLQLKDYSKTDWKWSLFDPEAKQKRHDTVFPQECQKAFEMGAELAR